MSVSHPWSAVRTINRERTKDVCCGKLLQILGHFITLQVDSSIMLESLCSSQWIFCSLIHSLARSLVRLFAEQSLLEIDEKRHLAMFSALCEARLVYYHHLPLGSASGPDNLPSHV